jgi:hypothetical protein
MILRQFSGAASVAWLCLCVCASSPAADAGYQDWQFTNSANPAPPTAATNTAGTAAATIIVGYASSGWLDSVAGLGTQTGLWDLGGQDSSDPAHDTRGLVLLSIPNPGPASGNSYTDLRLRVVQFVNGVFYTGDLTFSIPGAVYSGRTVVESVPGSFGGSWVEDQFQWHLTPRPVQVSLTITGAADGTLLDRIRADTVSAVVAVAPPIITSVARSSQGLVITWAGGVPPYQIYVTSNLLSNASWQAVGPPVSGTNAEITLTGPAHFVKVGGSN